MSNFDYKGVGVALITPFNADGSVDFGALGRMMDSVIDGGVDYIVALGTTAETPAIVQDEREAIARYIKSLNNGRVPVVIGIGGNCTKEVIDAVAAMLGTLPPVRRYEREEIPLETLLAKQNTGFTITVEDDVYIVDAPFLIKILCRTDLDDYESLQYFQRVLISSGIIDALREKGIQEGDIVSVYDFEFEFVN